MDLGPGYSGRTLQSAKPECVNSSGLAVISAAYQELCNCFVCLFDRLFGWLLVLFCFAALFRDVGMALKM